MALREVITHPDPRLSRPSDPLPEVNDEVRKLLRDLAETMYAAPGVGLAAPQLGVNLRAVVIDIGPVDQGGSGLIQIVNPVIESSEGSISWDEGCLSVPGMNEEVQRAVHVVVSGLDINGEPLRYDVEDFLAVAFQHEIDHLDGLLFFERLSPLKRKLLLKEYRKQQLENE
ncbi:MAG: peptide deformylase [Candidatus Alcyoniella australis]|nr:peptide deformylase [Candidatus Alcyoniella australis]